MSSNRKGPNPVSRRSFLKTTVAKGGAGVALAAAGLHPKEAEAADIKWDRSADVVVVGAGVSGLACACAARDAGASEPAEEFLHSMPYQRQANPQAENEESDTHSDCHE